MATGTLLTIDDLERLPAEIVEHHELVDGELVDVGLNTEEHLSIQGHLVEVLQPVARMRKLGKIYFELGYDFLGNVHCPDVSFIGSEKLASVDPKKRVQRFVPDLAIEIASESDTYRGLLRKIERYLKAGTKEVWLISSDPRHVRICGPDLDRTLRGKDVVSTALIPGFSITVDELFTEL
jgi:Uma2 family endonuclease